MEHIGGQAVIEGVMMRNKNNYAISVRLQNGKIKTKGGTIEMFGSRPQVQGKVKSYLWRSFQL